MQENVGKMDRWLRVAVGGALVAGAARTLGARGAIAPGLLLATGVLVLDTALTRVCPLNAALGLDTRRSDAFSPLGLGAKEPAGESESRSQDMLRMQNEGGL